MGDALRAHLQRLSDQVGVLASIPALRAGIQTDQQTVAGQLANEGLEGLRKYEVYVIRRPPAGSPDHQPSGLLHGAGALTIEAIDALPAAKNALAGIGGSTVVALSDGAALLAFAPVSSNDGLFRAYLSIGERLGKRELAALSTDARAALLLSDGRRELGVAGDPSLAPALAGAVTHERAQEAPPFVDAAGIVAARSLELAPGLWLWAGAGVWSTAAVLEHEAALKIALAWIFLALAAIGLGGVLWLRGRPKRSAEAIAVDAGATPVPSPKAGASYPPGTTGPPLLVPVMLANGQVGQVVAASMPSASGVQPFLAPPPTGATDPTMFGRYKLLERLGAGGMAEVWIAVVFGAQGFRRPFVVKRILAQHTGNQDLVQQFIDEANLASQLVHSNVVPVFDFGNLNGEYFLA